MITYKSKSKQIILEEQMLYYLTYAILFLTYGIFQILENPINYNFILQTKTKFLFFFFILKLYLNIINTN